jgi:Piwi domain
MILLGVARQVLQKAGVRLWWTSLPRDLPLPTVFVGVDIFHAPREYDTRSKRRVAKPSCAAIVVQVLRRGSERTNTVEVYSETFRRRAGEEFGLEGQLRRAVSTALKALDVTPASCIVWRDGIADSSFGDLASQEIRGIQDGLNGGAICDDDEDDDTRGQKPLLIASGPACASGDVVQVATVETDDSKPPATTSALVPVPKSNVPMAYIVCQKMIATKFLSLSAQGIYGAPSGTLVDGIQGITHDTFYIQGRAPSFSTPKPVRFVVIQRDGGLDSVDLPRLTWDLCHDYPNWVSSMDLILTLAAASLITDLFLFPGKFSLLIRLGPSRYPPYACQHTNLRCSREP